MVLIQDNRHRVQGLNTMIMPIIMPNVNKMMAMTMITMMRINSCLLIGMLLPHHQCHCPISPSSAALEVQPQQCSPRSADPARNDVCTPHEDLVGKDAILYAILRSDLPVAKGTITSTNPNTIVGGQALGKQYCEVIVTFVLKRMQFFLALMLTWRLWLMLR